MPKRTATWGSATPGPLLSCNLDGAFCEGFDARLEMTRTQTIMDDATHCDFRYRGEEGGEGEGVSTSPR